MKNRDNIYLVARQYEQTTTTVIASYRSMEAADQHAHAENQKWRDKGLVKESEEPFTVWVTTYYDE